jgi:hypothetical protein
MKLDIRVGSCLLELAFQVVGREPLVRDVTETSAVKAYQRTVFCGQPTFIVSLYGEAL